MVSIVLHEIRPTLCVAPLGVRLVRTVWPENTSLNWSFCPLKTGAIACRDGDGLVVK
jgi:hypothetical protein